MILVYVFAYLIVGLVVSVGLAHLLRRSNPPDEVANVALWMFWFWPLGVPFSLLVLCTAGLHSFFMWVVKR